ncbi:MAG: YabP/YqfC family sporulation protein [Clostridia bacterium]|nr:YabP/YqfC family sporulation protein [Clostridia bacterium]
MAKGDFREKIQKAMEIPVELLSSYPRITLLGNESVFIENYQSIVEYEKTLIRISNNVIVYGSDLNVEEITSDEMLIVGKIKSIEFE